MKKSRAIYLRIAVVMLFIAAVVFISFLFSSIIDFRDNIYKTSEDYSRVLAQESAIEIDGILGQEMEQVNAMASGVSSLSTPQEIHGFLKNYRENDVEIVAVRYFKDGIEYDESGTRYEGNEDSEVLCIINQKGYGCTGFVEEGDTGNRSIAFIANVVSCELVDSVVAFSPVRNLFADYNNGMQEELIETGAVYHALCGTTGNSRDDSILYKASKDDFDLGKSTNFFTALEQISHDDNAVTTLQTAADNNENAVTSVVIGGVRYVIALGSSADAGIFSVSLYEARSLVDYEYAFISKITGSGVAFGVVMVFLLVCFLMVRWSYSMRINSSENVDPIIGCNTYRRFAEQAEEIIESNRASRFAMVYFELDNYKFIVSQFGSNKETEVLKFTGKVISKCLSQNEIYAHISDGNFVLLVHHRDEKELTDKIKLIYAILFNYQGLKEENFTLKFYAGIYCIPKNSVISINAMLDNAVLAQRTHIEAHNSIYNFFDPNIDKQRQREQEIEAKKELALKNNEFKVFFQPKYNISKMQMDGAEALVRWYNPAKDVYYPPAIFLHVFEANGFIEELDHYTYLKVCEYMKDRVYKGKRIFPISVNVSRFTAMQPDFLHFIISNKQKHQIADNFIMLEFTESFAYENYDALRDIVVELRKNGIHCSIDDFGSGYSSYNILKELPMDELKLDRFFILPGINRERDDHLLYSIIQLGKKLGLKVTQEGVESEEDMRRLKKMGCDVVQRFFYSVPLNMDEYDRFIEQHLTIHKIV